MLYYADLETAMHPDLPRAVAAAITLGSVIAPTLLTPTAMLEDSITSG